MEERIVITRPIPQAPLNWLREEMTGADVAVHDRDDLSTSELLKLCVDGTSGMIVTLADNLSRSTIERLPESVKVISTYAVGFNNIDLEACRERGIAVTNTPDVLTDATAEVAVGLILACARSFIPGDALTRRGEFNGWQPLLHLGHQVYGVKVGIVGAGRIGQRVAHTMHHGFDCPILYHSRSRKLQFDESCRAEKVTLEQLIEESDIISLHCPLTAETRHLLGASEFAAMQDHTIVVNTARGPCIDEAALVEVLRSGQIAGAGLDVFENEPELAPGLAELDNVVVLPHIGSATYRTRDAMGWLCVRAVAAELRGDTAKNRLV